MEIESATRLGSHTFFIGRLVHDERRATEPEFFYVHGIYQAWRLTHLSAVAAS